MWLQKSHAVTCNSSHMQNVTGSHGICKFPYLKAGLRSSPAMTSFKLAIDGVIPIALHDIKAYTHSKQRGLQEIGILVFKYTTHTKEQIS